MVIRFKMGGFFSKDNEKPSLGKKNGADIECGDGETEQMAQVACCMTIKVPIIVPPQSTCTLCLEHHHVESQ